MSEEESDYVEVDESTKRQIERFHKQYPIVSEDEIFHFIEKYNYNMNQVETELHKIYGTDEKYKNLEDFNWNIVTEKKPKERKQEDRQDQTQRRQRGGGYRGAPARAGTGRGRGDNSPQRYQRAGTGRGYRRQQYQDCQDGYPQNTQNAPQRNGQYEERIPYSRAIYRQPMRRGGEQQQYGVRYQRRGSGYRGRGYGEKGQRRQQTYKRAGYNNYGRVQSGYRLKQKPTQQQQQEVETVPTAPRQNEQPKRIEEREEKPEIRQHEEEEEDIYLDAGVKQSFYGNEEEERPNEDIQENTHSYEDYQREVDRIREQYEENEQQQPQEIQQEEPKIEQRRQQQRQKYQKTYQKVAAPRWKKKEQTETSAPEQDSQPQAQDEQPDHIETKQDVPKKEEPQVSRNQTKPVAYPGDPSEAKVADAPAVVQPEPKPKTVPVPAAMPATGYPGMAPQSMGMHPMMMHPGMPHPYMFPGGLPPMYPPTMMPPMMPHGMYPPGTIPASQIPAQPQAKVGANVSKDMPQYMPMPYYIGKGEGGQPIMYPPPMYYMPMGNGKEGGYAMMYPGAPMPEKKENPK